MPPNTDDPRTQTLQRLGTDYADVTGEPFDHFFCPILYRDDPLDPTEELCKGHIVPQAFRGSARTWTLQRCDVESFFGTLFEAGFSVLQEKGKHTVTEILEDKKLFRDFRPDILLNGEEVHYYRPEDEVPEHHSEIEVTDGYRNVRLGLKMEPSELLEHKDGNWQFDSRRDLRLDSMVALIKAAHLTMFDLLGYRYALSAGGYFVGYDMLGRYVEENLELEDRPQMLRNAREHFAEFTSIVRPILGLPDWIEGTVTDGVLQLCGPLDSPWGFIVVVRTGDLHHGVLLPIQENPHAAVKYLNFLEDPFPKIESRLMQWDDDDKQWLIAPSSSFLDWPSDDSVGPPGPGEG